MTDETTERTVIELQVVEVGPLSNQAIVAALRSWAAIEGNAKYILVRFTGEGDSGDIESADPIKTPELDGNHYFEWDYGTQRSTGPNIDVPFGCVDDNGDPLTVHDAVAKMARALLGRDEIPDWYNNEGGRGEIVFDLTTGEINASVQTREISYNDHSFEYKLAGF